MAFFEFLLDRDLSWKGKRLNKGSYLAFTTPGDRKYTPSEVLKAAKEKFPEFAHAISSSSFFKEKK